MVEGVLFALRVKSVLSEEKEVEEETIGMIKIVRLRHYRSYFQVVILLMIIGPIFIFSNNFSLKNGQKVKK